MNVSFKGYDIAFAVEVRRIMLYQEWGNNENRLQSVWIPTQAFLQDLADCKPKRITCFLGKAFHFSQRPGSSFANVFIANRRKEVAYLGTVFNDEAFLHYARTSQGKPFKRRIMKVVRDPVYYIIPSGTSALDETVVVDSIKRYFLSYQGTSIAQLAETDVRFVAGETGANMDDTIRQLAKNFVGG